MSAGRFCRLKRILAVLLCLFTAVSCFCIYAYADNDAGSEEKTTESGDTDNKSSRPSMAHVGSAYLYCAENGQALFAFNEKKSVFPASTAKIMTGILALEYFKDNMDEIITVDGAWLSGVSGNYIGLTDGEEVSARDLIASLIVGNANDCALVLANIIGGSIDGFVSMMNEKASVLGAENTKYTNPTGMHSQTMVTTAEDTAKISLYAYKLGKYTEFASMSLYTVGKTNKSSERNIHNRNCYISKWNRLDYFDPDISGMNAGATDQAGYCLVATEYRDGLTYICVIMDAEYDEEEDIIYSYTTASELLDWSDGAYSYVKIVDPSVIICEVPVEMSSKTDYVTLLPESSVELFLPVDTDIEKEIVIEKILNSETLTAPVASGEVVGMLTVTYKNEIVGRVSLITKNSVDSDSFMHVMKAVKSVISSIWFKLSVLLIFLAAVAYVLITARIRYIKSMSRKYGNPEYFKTLDKTAGADNRQKEAPPHNGMNTARTDSSGKNGTVSGAAAKSGIKTAEPQRKAASGAERGNIGTFSGESRDVRRPDKDRPVQKRKKLQTEENPYANKEPRR